MTLPEKIVIEFIKRGSMLEILSLQLVNFTRLYKVRPEIILFAKELRTAFVAEAISALAVPVGCTVCEPIWLDGIPILFRPTGDSFLVMKSSAVGKELVL